MSDIQKSGNDFQIVDGDLVVIENSHRVAQEVVERLQSFAYEWFLDEEGLPYFEALTGKNRNISYLKNIILDTVTRTNGVHSVENFNINYDTVTRQINVELSIKTVYNEVTSIVIPSFGELQSIADSTIILDRTSDAVRDLELSALRERPPTGP